MIDGITVLTNVTVSDFNPAPWLGVFIGLIVAFIIIYSKVSYSDKQNVLCLCCEVFVFFLILFVGNIQYSKVDAIQCTIEDYVTINEVYDKYDVIDKQGEIWTLKEKTNEKV